MSLRFSPDTCSKMSRTNEFAISVPATSANLGPGFDAIGIALDLRLRAKVSRAKRFTLRFEHGKHSPTHDGFERAIVDAMRRIDSKLPQVNVTIENAIPLGKGLGSSAAASVLGLAIAQRARNGAVRRAHVAQIACEIEGHPDNALPAVYGGAVVAASAKAFVLIPPPALHAAVVVPDLDLATTQARALLPDRYDRADAVFNAQRAALLAASLASGNIGGLREAMRDRIHQPYRARSIPGLERALAVESPDLLGVALSGAGPSVLNLSRTRAAAALAATRIAKCFEDAGISSTTMSLRLTRGGLA